MLSMILFFLFLKCNISFFITYRIPIYAIINVEASKYQSFPIKDKNRVLHPSKLSSKLKCSLWDDMLFPENEASVNDNSVSFNLII